MAAQTSDKQEDSGNRAWRFGASLKDEEPSCNNALF